MKDFKKLKNKNKYSISPLWNSPRILLLREIFTKICDQHRRFPTTSLALISEKINNNPNGHLKLLVVIVIYIGNLERASQSQPISSSSLCAASHRCGLFDRAFSPPYVGHIDDQCPYVGVAIFLLEFRLSDFDGYL